MPGMIDHPAHYNAAPREVIDLAERLGFCAGNIVKYVLRAPYKDDRAGDIGKARWYAERLRATRREWLTFDEWCDCSAVATAFGSPAVTALLQYLTDYSEDNYALLMRRLAEIEAGDGREEDAA